MERCQFPKSTAACGAALFDLPKLKDHITSGVLLFSDESAVKVGELPNDANSAREGRSRFRPNRSPGSCSR